MAAFQNHAATKPLQGEPLQHGSRHPTRADHAANTPGGRAHQAHRPIRRTGPDGPQFRTMLQPNPYKGDRCNMVHAIPRAPTTRRTPPADAPIGQERKEAGPSGRRQ